VAAGALRKNTQSPWAMILVDDTTSVDRALTWVREWFAQLPGGPVVRDQEKAPGIVVQLADSSDDFGRWEVLAAEHPGSLALTRGFKSVRSRHGYLSTVPRPDAIADFTATDAVFKRRLAKNAPFYVRDGGTYTVDEPKPGSGGVGGESAEEGGAMTLLKAYSAWYVGSDNRRDHDLIELGTAFCGMESHRDAGGEEIGFRRDGNYMRKLRDCDATKLLSDRYGDTWGVELSRRPAHQFRVTSEVTTNRNAQRFPDSFEVPDV